MTDPTSQELLQLTQRLLDSIASADWATYEELCDPTLTCFEPEGRGQLVMGMPFHHFYFHLGGVHGRNQTTLASPYVRLLGEAGIVSYIRLTQRLGPDGGPMTVCFEETRVWHRKAGKWKMVHFHRSSPQ